MNRDAITYRPPSAQHVMAWLCAAIVAAASPALGQAPPSPDPSLRFSQYVLDAWTVEDGLPQSAVLTMKEGPDGYLWVATQAGLARFDGTRFEVFDRQDGLGNNEVRSLEFGAEGELWIGTHGGGLSRMDEDSVTTFTTEDGLPSNLVRSLHRSRDGALWIGTIEGGLSRLEGGEFQNFGMEDGLAGNVVLAIEETAEGELWVGTEAGLTIYDGDSFTTSQDERVKGRLVWAFERAENGGYWVGLSGGLALVRNGSVAAHHTTGDGLCGEVVDALHLDGHGALWIGTLGGGLCRLAKGRFETMREADGLASDRVRALLEDREGNVWIGTESGLNRIRQGKFVHVTSREGLADDMVMAVQEDARGALWVGTKSGGLTRISSAGTRTYSAADGLPSTYVSALHTVGDGLWIGLYGGGACKLTDEAFSCVDEADGLPSNNVYAVLEDRKGDVWIGTDAGLRVLRGGRITAPGDEALSNEQISVIHETADGDVWVGARGIYVIRGETTHRLGSEWGLPEAIVTVLFEEEDGSTWVGTYGSGLCLIEDEAVRCLTSKGGLPSDQILQVLVDDRGDLWLGTQQGLARMSVSDVRDVLDGRTPTVPYDAFERADGAKFGEVNGGTQPSAWKMRDGRLAFSTNHGAALIDPSTIRTNRVPPAVHVEGIDVNGTPIDLNGDVRVGPGSRDITFHYTGISFTAPEEVRFKYMLVGYDADWVEAGNRHDAYYTNLSPGEYTFRVVAANNDGVWNEEGDTVTFYLEPYFYQTWWFAVLCGLAAIGAAFGGFRLRIRQLRARERELEQQVDERTRDLRKEKERTEEAKQVIEGQADQLRDLNQDLEEQAEKLRDLNDNLQQKVQEQFELLVKERERYESDLIDAKERAEASDRLKTAILNNLSHEFRTPLTAILGFTEIISMEAPDDLKEFTAEIDRGGKRLLRTLDALLEFSRLEANESGLKPTDVDLTTAAVGVVTDLKKVAERKNVAVRFKASAPVRATLDAAAVEEIIWNLVDNGIKFTREGEVFVSAGTEADRAYIRVQDTGVGIGEEFRERMFEAFAQESDGFNRSFEGVGLGLTITKRLAEHMGGEIDVETEVGVGSSFTVYFPMHTPPTAPA